MSVKELRKKLRTRWRRFRKALKVARYNFRLRFFGWRNNTKARVVTHWRRQVGNYSATAYLVLSLSLSLIAPTWFANFGNEDVLGFYTSIGGMTGGMLAIIFTFITLLANYALTEYPSEFFRLSGNDRRQVAIYVLLAIISVLFFIVGLSYPGNLQENYLLNAVTVFLLSSVLFLIFVSYLTMRTRLNPKTAFKAYIVEPALKLIDEAEKKANKVAKLFASNPSVQDDEIERHAKQQGQMLVSAHYSQLNDYIAIMYDYHAMLRERKRERAAINVLAGIQTILFRYIDARKDNSILLPTDYLMVLQSDSQNFFASNFERIIAKLSEYIDDNNVEGIRNTLTMYTNLGIKLSEMDFGSTIRGQNPSFEQCFGYLDQARDMAMQKKNVEATFEIAKAYGNLGAVAITKDFDHGQSYAYDSLQSLYVYAIVSKQDSVSKQVVWSFGKMTNALFAKSDIDLNYTDFTLFLSNYKKLTKTYLLGQTNSYDLSPNNSQDILLPVRHLYARFKTLVRTGSNTRNPDRVHHQHDAIEIVDTIREIARNLSDTENTQVVDRYFYLELMRILHYCILKLIDLKTQTHWQRNRREIESTLTWTVNQFGFGLRNISDKVENSNLDELAEILTVDGLYAILKADDETTKIAMTLVTAMADASMRSGDRSVDWEAPRIMMNVYILATAALNQNRTELLKHARVCVGSFKKNYLATLHKEKFSIPAGARYIGTYPDQFNYEMARFVRRNEDVETLPYNTPLVGVEKPQGYAERVFEITDEQYSAIRSYLKQKPTA